MKLTRENIYINLKGKSKEKLTELYWLLKNNNQPLIMKGLKSFINYSLKYNYLSLGFISWIGCEYVDSLIHKQEVTIQQLKEILQPMENKETIEQQLEKAEAEVKRLKEAIEDSEIKVGDLVCYTSIRNKKVMLFGYCEDIKDNNIYIGGLNYEYKQWKKITDQDLINKLNELIK